MRPLADPESVIVEDFIDDSRPGSWIADEDIDVVTEQILESQLLRGWVRFVDLQLGAKRWRPSAVSADGSALLYVFLQEDLPNFVADRLRLAVSSGLEAIVALNISSLFKADIVELLVDIEADVLVLDDYAEDRRLEPRSVPTALADIEIPVAPELRKVIGRIVWERIRDGAAHVKGRRLESLLAFFFTQIRDLKVVERNYRTESEEIDLVLQVDSFSSNAWQNPGVPFILVEAKNRADKASQQMMSALITKLQTKRGTARIGVLVSLAGFTEDARLQELRFSTQDICVVMIDGALLFELIESEDMDEALERVVRRALLR